jgi:hypothetical protein
MCTTNTSCQLCKRAKQLLAAWKPPLSVPGHVSACISARVERCSAREICRGGVEKIEESMAKRRCRTTCSPAVQGPSLQVPLSENLRGALPDAVLTCRMGGRRIGDAACNIQKLTSVRASCKLTPSPLFCTLNTFVLHSDPTATPILLNFPAWRPPWRPECAGSGVHFARALWVTDATNFDPS